ncbi:protein trichome birefringence-like 14 [Lolium rigidum]|uniref:protein trichome birefringence-like 14 n=1 Tax=Lolium rigidum TaxID=89674 RepID=UPI001F5E0BAE|nr:protein trichome birefringence-like 14 [Lolium rigidum]
MKGGFIHKLLVDKPWLGLVILFFAMPIIVLVLLGGSPVLTDFSITPEQRKAFSQGLEQQGQHHFGNDVSGGLVGSPGPTYNDSRSQKTATRDDGKYACAMCCLHYTICNVNIVYLVECNYAKGKWIADEKRPLYSGYECKQWLPKKYNCGGMGRTDLSFESYRWQPHGCEMPEVSGPNFLNRMRHKTLAFIGDSLGRQQFMSMMCIATGGKRSREVEDVGWKYGLDKAPHARRTEGWAYRFPGTNTTVLFYWSPSLCELEPLTNTTRSAKSYALHLDRPERFLKKYLHCFDTLVLNTGHHWNKERFSINRWKLYADGKPLGNGTLPEDLGPFRNLKLRNIARWLDSELVHRPHMKVFLRTNSPRHFLHGDWNTGGSCNSTTPLSGGSEVLDDHSSDLPAEHAVIGTRVKLLDITSISQLRSEGHIAHHTFKSLSAKYDCSHWCLPGIPDMWNEILFAQI